MFLIANVKDLRAGQMTGEYMFLDAPRSLFIEYTNSHGRNTRTHRAPQDQKETLTRIHSENV